MNDLTLKHLISSNRVWLSFSYHPSEDLVVSAKETSRSQGGYQRLPELVFQPWNLETFYLFQRSKQRARLLDADQFTWSQLRFLNESSKDNTCILCENQTSQNNKAKLSEDLCILGFELENAAHQSSLRQQCPNVVGLHINFLISSALSGSSDPILYKDYKSQLVVLVLQFCCQCCPCWFLFFFKMISYHICVFFLNPWVFGMEKVEPNWELVVVVAGFGLKKVAQQ